MMLCKQLIIPEILNSKDTTYMTHNYHPFPCKFVPQIPKLMIEKFTDENDTIMDPYCGSGTSLVEAKLNKRNSIGVDLHPISIIVSKVKTTKLSKLEIKSIEKVLNKIKIQVDNIYDSNDFYLKSDFFNRDHWFQRNVLKEIETIRDFIERQKNNRIKDFLKVALSSIIVSVSNQESETRYAAIDKNIPDYRTCKLFENKVEDMTKRMIEFSSLTKNNGVKVYRADSREIHFIPDNSVDFIITSPPYANTYDYYLYHKLRMYVLGYNVKEVRDNEIGSRNRHSSRKEGIESYIKDMQKCFEHFNRILKPNSLFVLVIGDSIIRNKFIDAFKMTKLLAKKTNFKYVQEIRYSLNLISKTFNSSFRNKTKNEHIILLKNVK